VVAVAFALVAPPALVPAVLVIGLVSAVTIMSKRDPLAILSLLFVVLLLLPEQFVVVGPLKSYGYPAQLVGIIAFGLWCAGHLMRHPAMSDGPRPLHWLMFGYAAIACSSLASAYHRSLNSGEASGTFRSVAATLAAVGIALYAADGLRTRSAIDSLLRRLVLCAAGEALIGIAEFLDHGFTIEFLRLPGFKTNDAVDTQVRSDFVRVHSTAVHSIEFAVLISALVPLALHYVIHAKTSRERNVMIGATILLLTAAPMTVARSGVVALVVALAVYSVQWTGRMRANAAVLTVIGLGAYRAAFPGLLGTLKSLLFIGNQDPSIAGRTEDYAKIPGLMDGHLWFGRGLGTFLPTQYFYLDNQYLGTYLEGGIVALVGMVVMLFGFMVLARGARKWAHDVSTRSLGQALTASLAALTVTAGTFDEFGFKQTYFVLFALGGVAASLWRLVRTQARERAAERAASLEIAVLGQLVEQSELGTRR
jgi:hypothetical protein